MKKQIINFKPVILGVSVLIFGIVILASVPDPVRYVGAILILLAIINIIFVILTKGNDPKDEHYESRIRNQILKHQYKK